VRTIDVRRPIAVAAASAALLWLWMFLTVRSNYGGDWTALFFIGPRTPQTPEVAREHPYLWPGTGGYDGQTFHIMAHDPWMRHAPPESLQIAPFRYTRILVPALAWTIALGRDRWIDPAYYGAIVGFAFLGAYWTSRWAVRSSRSPAWGFVFLLTPAAITSADRMLSDIALAAFCAGYAIYSAEGARWKIAAVLACAALTRETGWILLAVFGVWAIRERRSKDALLAAAAAAPAIAWEIYVASHSLGSLRPPPVGGWFPLAGFIHRVFHIFWYPVSPTLRIALAIADYVALAAVAAALAMAVRLAICREWTPLAAAIYGFALAAIFLKGTGEWDEVYSFGRLLTPLLFLTALDYLPRAGWTAFAPMLIISLRIAAWLEKQMAGILHALLK
jgi:hypothetical protein